MLRLDDGESGELIQPLTTQTLSYIGAASAATALPTYSSNHYILNTDNLTAALGKIDTWLFDETIKRDGTTAWTADNSVGGFKFTSLAAGSGAGHSVRYEQVGLLSGANTWGANQPMGGFKFTGLGAGTVNGDSLRYEQLIGVYLPLAGGTMSGAITMDGVNLNMGAAGSSDADDTDAQNNYIKKLRRPADNADAATKAYVDSLIPAGVSSVSGTYLAENYGDGNPPASLNITPLVVTHGLVGGNAPDTLIIVGVNRRSDDHAYTAATFAFFKKVLPSNYGGSYNLYSATNAISGFEAAGVNAVPAATSSFTYQSTNLISGVRNIQSLNGLGVGGGVIRRAAAPRYGSVTYQVNYANGVASVDCHNNRSGAESYALTPTSWYNYVLLDAWTSTAFTLTYNPDTTSAGDINSNLIANTFNDDSQGGLNGHWKKKYQYWAIYDPNNILWDQICHWAEPTKYITELVGGDGVGSRYENIPSPEDLLSLAGY